MIVDRARTEARDDCSKAHIYLYSNLYLSSSPESERRCKAILKRLTASTGAVREVIVDAKRFSSLQSALFAKFAVLCPGL
jgi:hypothetical protein